MRKVWHDKPKPNNDIDEILTINFTRRGWFTKEICKCEGELTYLDNGTRKPVFRVFGHWHDKLFMHDLRNGAKPEEVWSKTPDPENW